MNIFDVIWYVISLGCGSLGITMMVNSTDIWTIRPNQRRLMLVSGIVLVVISVLIVLSMQP